MKDDWEILFQPMFDEYLNPSPCVDSQVPANLATEPAVLIGTPSSTTIDQDAPSTSTSQTTPETPSPVIPLSVEEDYHDIKVAHIDNSPSTDFPILEPSYEESSSQVVTPVNVRSINQPPELLVIMEYLVNISKRRAFWSLNEDILKIYYSNYQYAVSIKEYTAYPCLHSPKTTKEQDQYAVSKEDQYTVFKLYYVNILEDIKHGPYSKKPQYAVSNPLNTPYRHRLQTV
ncbi:hypothetical protein Tco_0021986 [Tanacetum coccineum]